MKRLLHKIFGTAPKAAQPDVVFGRYTDAYKSAAQQAAFDRALDAFEQGDALASYRHFLVYLKDEQVDNLQWHEADGALHFEFWQGSRRIVGRADAHKVQASSKVAKAEELNIGFLRRLMEYNFDLRFTRFALDPDNNLCILFDTYTLDGAPHKLLQALRELAIHADKQDDLLLDEFNALRPAEERVYGDVPQNEKNLKLEYLRGQIEEVFAALDSGKPDPNQFPGTYAYALLALAFRLDYLVRPEGYMMDVMEKIHALYFSKSTLTAQLKVQHIRKEFQKLLDRPAELLFREMYRTRSTFGLNPPVGQGTVVGLIDGELSNMDWPLQHNHALLAMAVPQYIAGFALFHYVPPKPVRQLLHLFFKITEADFFRKMGFEVAEVDTEGHLQKPAVLKAIRAIADENRADFPGLKPNYDRLDFASDLLFAKSFLLLIKDLNLHRAE